MVWQGQNRGLKVVEQKAGGVAGDSVPVDSFFALARVDCSFCIAKAERFFVILDQEGVLIDCQDQNHKSCSGPLAVDQEAYV